MRGACTAANCSCTQFRATGKLRSSGVGKGSALCECNHIVSAHVNARGRTSSGDFAAAKGIGCVVILASLILIGVLWITSPGDGGGASSRAGSGGGGEDGRRISRSDFGNEWPFTVNSGLLQCRNGSEVVFIAGATYGINGTARGRGVYSEIDPIWLDDPEIAGYKKSVGPILDAGLDLC